jgi:hypothetical protein
LFVIGRNTAFTYRITQLDAKQVGRELGVRYLLEVTNSRYRHSRLCRAKRWADQAVELYWMALCRDVNFLDCGPYPLTQAPPQN